MNLKMPLVVFAAAFVVASCQSSQDTTSPSILSSGKADGVGYPSGASASGDALVLSGVAEEKDYAYTEKNPVRVGGLAGLSGPAAERHYLNALLGPEGQTITYERVGSCCAFDTDNSPLGGGLLDVYEVSYEGLEEPLQIYINMYDPGEPLVPMGLTSRKK